MAKDSNRVVYAALAGNVAVAAAKYAAALTSGSSAMLTEAIHSTSDCANQVLLLVGASREKKPADAVHPFGYGMETYFWTFVVGVLVLLTGGVYSLYQGYERWIHPEAIRMPAVNLIVLGLSAVFEGASFAIGYREYRAVTRTHVIPGESVGLFHFIKRSKDPNLYETLLEDGAALIGIAIAVVGTIAGAYLGWKRADGGASIAIGLLLLANGTMILRATRSLMAGEAVAPPLLKDLWRAAGKGGWLGRIERLQTLHLGPSCIVIAVNLTAPRRGEQERDLQRTMDRHLRAVDDRIIEVLFRYDGGKEGGGALPPAPSV